MGVSPKFVQTCWRNTWTVLKEYFPGRELTDYEVVVKVPTILACEHEEKEVNIKNGSVFFIEQKLSLNNYCLLNQEGSKYSTMTSLICKDTIRTDRHLPFFKIALMKYLYLVSVISLKVGKKKNQV